MFTKSYIRYFDHMIYFNVIQIRVGINSTTFFVIDCTGYNVSIDTYLLTWNARVNKSISLTWHVTVMESDYYLLRLINYLLR